MSSRFLTEPRPKETEAAPAPPSREEGEPVQAMPSPQALVPQLKQEAARLGFAACGIAKAGPVEEATASRLRQWLAQGGHADMAYMQNHIDMRLNPQLLMPGVRSIVCVALNYTPAAALPEGEYQLAAYALGQDYHQLVKQRLHQLAAHLKSLLPPHIPLAYRAFCDSAPMLERYWAVKAGLGWTGRNHQLIIPHAGSMFFLGELFVDVELAADQPMEGRCGSCKACMDACPTQALTPTTFSAEKCLSYQLIENRNALSEEAVSHMGDTIYGCDRCQQACPWNRFAHPNTLPELQPKAELLGMTREQWQNLSEEEYRRLFKGSAVKRTKYAGLMRNIQAARSQEENNTTHEKEH